MFTLTITAPGNIIPAIEMTSLSLHILQKALKGITDEYDWVTNTNPYFITERDLIRRFGSVYDCEIGTTEQFQNGFVGKLIIRKV